MRAEQLATPWERQSRLYSVPGSLVMKVVLGELPEAIPATVDVQRGAHRPSTVVGVGVLDRLVGEFSDGMRVSRVHAAAASLGRPGAAHLAYSPIEHTLGLSRTVRVDVDRDVPIGDLVEALRQTAVVEAVYPQYVCATPFESAVLERRPAGPADAHDGGWLPREQVNAALAMGYEAGDPAVIVAVCDTGTAASHPEWSPARMRRGWDTVRLGGGDLSEGMQVVGDRIGLDDEPLDADVGHGTACLGIIGASGERMPPGLAGECSLLPIRSLGAARVPGRKDPLGVGSISDIDAGVKMAIDLGAKVLNLSFGTPASALAPGDPLPHADVVRYGLARGCVMVAASGNSGKREEYSPAVLPGVIAVCAVTSDDRPTRFSTTGDHVALAAPGERILTAALEDAYQHVTGTSFAAPFVTAAAALMVSRALRRAFPLDGNACGRLLVETARPWPASLRGLGYGAGILDVHAALRALDREIDQQLGVEG